MLVEAMCQKTAREFKNYEEIILEERQPCSLATTALYLEEQFHRTFWNRIWKTMAKSVMLPVVVNKVLLEYNCAHSLGYFCAAAAQLSSCKTDCVA